MKNNMISSLCVSVSLMFALAVFINVMTPGETLAKAPGCNAVCTNGGGCSCDGSTCQCQSANCGGTAMCTCLDTGCANSTICADCPTPK